MVDLDAVYREHSRAVYRFLLAKTGSARLPAKNHRLYPSSPKAEFLKKFAKSDANGRVFCYSINSLLCTLEETV